MLRELTQAIVLSYLQLVSGTFNTRSMQAELGIITPEGKGHLRVILHRLCEAGVIAKTSLDGTYRKIEAEKVPMDWRSADPGNIVALKWPFELEKYAAIYPKNIALIAGSKQEGKSTFLYNFIKLNMNKHRIDLFNSETGKEQMKDRFVDLGIPLDAPFDVYERYDNFADVIDPDRISVIDYLDLNSEFYLAGAEIDAIFRKLNTGIAVIGMQIPPPTVTYTKGGVKKVIDRDYAYGGGTTAKRAFIYVSMSSHRLKLKHVKKPTQKKVNPENMCWSYTFNEVGNFCNIERYYGEKPHFQCNTRNACNGW